MDDSQLISDFFSSDVQLGDRALKAAIAERGQTALQLLIPEEIAQGRTASVQVERRLAKLASALEENPAAIDYLVRVIRDGSWHSANLASPALAGVARYKARAEAGLADILKKGTIDSQRLAIEALGYLGASGLVWEITEFGKYREWPFARNQQTRPSKHDVDKFHHFILQALIRMTSSLTVGSDIVRCLSAFKDFLSTCDELLDEGRVTTSEVRFVQHHLPPRAADPLRETWIESDSKFLQNCGTEALGFLRLRRTSRFLLDVLEDEHFDRSVRLNAGISLSQFADVGAAAKLAERLRRVSGSPGFPWAFASLYALDAAWPECDDLIDRLLDNGDNDSEISAHLVYSLAHRGDRRAERCFSALNSRHPHIRASGALACARLDPEGAREALSGCDGEASNRMELVCLLAAEVHAGNTQKIDSLHQALTTYAELPLLRPIWKREVLYAFFAAEGSDSERGRLWCEAAAENPQRVAAEMHALLWRGAVKVKRPPAQVPRAGPAAALSVPSRQVQHKFDVFISHASEDKKRIAEPLFHALKSSGVRVWFDQSELKLGDQLRRKIDEGLAQCRFGVVILSPNFLAKEWPKTELDALMARETRSGTKAILPILHDLTIDDLLEKSPTLADRLACRSSDGIAAIVEQIRIVLSD